MKSTKGWQSDMFIESIQIIAGMSIIFVKTKFPEEYKDPRYSDTIFSLVDMVGDELVKKNSELFIEPVINNLVSIKEIKGKFV